MRKRTFYINYLKKDNININITNKKIKISYSSLQKLESALITIDLEQLHCAALVWCESNHFTYNLPNEFASFADHLKSVGKEKIVQLNRRINRWKNIKNTYKNAYPLLMRWFKNFSFLIFFLFSSKVCFVQLCRFCDWSAFVAMNAPNGHRIIHFNTSSFRHSINLIKVN